MVIQTDENVFVSLENFQQSLAIDNKQIFGQLQELWAYENFEGHAPDNEALSSLENLPPDLREKLLSGEEPTLQEIQRALMENLSSKIREKLEQEPLAYFILAYFENFSWENPGDPLDNEFRSYFDNLPLEARAELESSIAKPFESLPHEAQAEIKNLVRLFIENMPPETNEESKRKLAEYLNSSLYGDIGLENLVPPTPDNHNTDYFVSKNGNDFNTGRDWNHSFTTIGRALDPNETNSAKGYGDTVFVDGGPEENPFVYEETITVWNGVTLQSSHSPDYPYSNTRATIRAPAGVSAGNMATMGDGSVIEGFHITGGGTWWYGVYCPGTSPTIKNNIIDGSGWGVCVTGSGSPTIDGNVIGGNYWSGI
ncbi:MAG: hypothetical protein AB1476_02770, partial [Candidatus Hadarchaeota archaeon]